jgi:hypothetical protein
MNIQAKGQAFVDEEVKRLCDEIKRLGSQGADGKWFVNFGPLYGKSIRSRHRDESEQNEAHYT